MMRASLAQPRRAAIFAAVCGAALVHADCDDDAFDPASQIGPNPTLPAPHQYLFPPMHLSSVTGWKTGEKPTVPDGLKVKRFDYLCMMQQDHFIAKGERSGRLGRHLGCIICSV